MSPAFSVACFSSPNPVLLNVVKSALMEQNFNHFLNISSNWVLHIDLRCTIKA